MPLKIFLSHAWADKEHALLKELMNQLQDGYDVWVDKHNIDFGENINDKISAAISECDVFMIAWSNNAALSDAVRFEIQTAYGLQKPVVPCVIDEADMDISPFAGVKHFRFTGNAVNDFPQMQYLRNFLLRFTFQKTDTNTWADNLKSEWDKLKSQTGNIKGVLTELEDVFSRMKNKYSGNDSSNTYLQSALGAFDKLLGGNNKYDKILEFSNRMKQISAQYPDQKDDELKQRLMLQSIYEIDPGQTEEELNILRQSLESRFGSQEALQPGIATVLPAQDTANPVFQKLRNRKLVYLDTNTAGLGSSYSSSSTKKFLLLYEDGSVTYHYSSSSYAAGVGSIGSEDSITGQWGTNGTAIWFKWENGQTEECAVDFSTPGEVYLNGVRYFIVDLDYRI